MAYDLLCQKDFHFLDGLMKSTYKKIKKLIRSFVVIITVLLIVKADFSKFNHWQQL